MTDQEYNFPSEAKDALPGHSGNTDETQNAMVYQLQEILRQSGCTERLDRLTMLRFLRARKWNVELSKKMFLDCEKWRKESELWGGSNLDDEVKNFEYHEKPNVFEYYPQYYHKTDKDGRPVYIEALGNIDLNAMLKITTEERMLTNLAVEYEKLADPRLPACSRKAGHLLETCCTITDLKGVGITKAPQVYGYLKKLTGISQDYYPERLGKLYVINAPWGFSTVFGIVKGFLDPVTVQKIHVLGSGYREDLLKQVSPENLPKEFGGTCECEGGCQLSDAGPWQDAQYQGPYFKPKDADNAIDNGPSAAQATNTEQNKAEAS